MTEGRATGSSIGGITAIGVACQYTAEMFIKAYDDMPGKKFMEYEKKAEEDKNIFHKIFYGVATFIGARRVLTDAYLKYFTSKFNWSMVPAKVELYVGFCLTSELAKVSGLDGAFTFVDLRTVMKQKKPAAELAKDVNIYFGAKDGVYRFSKSARSLVKVSNTVIPLGRLALMTMANPAFRKVDVMFKDDYAFDGGIANNHANCAQVGDYYQLVCTAEGGDEKPDELSSYYRGLGPAPVKTFYCQPAHPTAFLEFTDAALKIEADRPATTFLG